MNKVDKLNNAFLTIVQEDTAEQRRINKEIIEEEKDIKQSVKDNSKSIKRDARFYLLIGALTAILSHRALTDKEKVKYAPVIAVSQMYSTKYPNLFAKKIDKINTGYGLGKKEKQAKVLLDSWFDKNKVLLNKVERRMLDTRIREKSKMYRNVKKLLKTTDKTRIELKKEYNKKPNVIRAIRTEAHAELEETKNLQADDLGYKYKVWMTREDGNVRPTAWHKAVANKRVPIDSEFRAVGMHAMYPGDISLPVGERINCRCYLLYLE